MGGRTAGGPGRSGRSPQLGGSGELLLWNTTSNAPSTSVRESSVGRFPSALPEIPRGSTFPVGAKGKGSRFPALYCAGAGGATRLGGGPALAAGAGRVNVPSSGALGTFHDDRWGKNTAVPWGAAEGTSTSFRPAGGVGTGSACTGGSALENFSQNPTTEGAAPSLSA